MEAQRRDPRDIITQDAFHVDADLLGTPLATPKRRLAALLLDLLLATILAQFGGFWLGWAVAIIFFRIATRKALDHPLKRWTGLLGVFQVFWDTNRQGIHDRIAHTAVIRERR